MNGGEYIDRWREALINGRQYLSNLTNNNDFTKQAISWYPSPKYDSAMVGSDECHCTSFSYDRDMNGILMAR